MCTSEGGVKKLKILRTYFMDASQAQPQYIMESTVVKCSASHKLALSTVGVDNLGTCDKLARGALHA